MNPLDRGNRAVGPPPATSNLRRHRRRRALLALAATPWLSAFGYVGAFL
jgi:hypothetical protein